ncbi:hypothetical protein RRG08_015676 [Elysia crispata]|uniref:Uncharacterized protein n=1 Tax=Elysia crispata TaxID=231223 RepID=A0AAE1CS24_9GAST|nr:hypothetical protein RRG08_015676 [Elysia crispata]
MPFPVFTPPLSLHHIPPLHKNAIPSLYPTPFTPSHPALAQQCPSQSLPHPSHSITSRPCTTMPFPVFTPPLSLHHIPPLHNNALPSVYPTPLTPSHPALAQQCPSQSLPYPSHSISRSCTKMPFSVFTPPLSIHQIPPLHINALPGH